MREIPSDLNERLNYDIDTGIFTWIKENKHHPRLTGTTAGCEMDGYLIIKLNGNSFRAHRLAWFYVTGNQPNIIDHINGNGTDNRFCNLRNVDQLANARNHCKRHNNSGLPCGVRVINGGRYQARININKTLTCLGVFDSPEEAHDEYEKARIREFKQYARVFK
jgi:hypothetical protein